VAAVQDVEHAVGEDDGFRQRGDAAAVGAGGEFLFEVGMGTWDSRLRGNDVFFT
jgi:hypothetical protein